MDTITEDYSSAVLDTIETYVYDDTDGLGGWEGSGEESEIEDSLNIDISLTNNIHNTIIPVPPVTKSCSRCAKITNEKDSTLQCFKCKSYVHYVCSRLPGYMLYLLKTTEFFYVCEFCVSAPKEFRSFDVQTKTDNIDDKAAAKMMLDINTSLHGLSNSVDSLRSSIPAKNENMQKSVAKIESKISSLEMLIEEKLSSMNENATKDLFDNKTATENMIMEQTIASQEQEIDMLEVVLADKNLFIEKLIEENKDILSEVTDRDGEFAKLTEDIQCHKAHAEKQKVVINKLKNHVKLLEGENNTRLMEKDRNKKIYELYERLRNASEIIPRTHEEICRLQKSVNILQDHLQQARTNTHHIKLLQKDSKTMDLTPGEDVVIVHDSYFKYVPSSFESLSIRKIWAPSLDEAYYAISNLRTTPNVILLHTGTADLTRLTEHEMVDRVMKIYNRVQKHGAKFIFSGIPVRKDQQFDLKVQLFNAMVVSKLSFADGVTICRNDETTKVFNDEPLHTINLIQ